MFLYYWYLVSIIMSGEIPSRAGLRVNEGSGFVLAVNRRLSIIRPVRER
jgi:hypothetical protein